MGQGQKREYFSEWKFDRHYNVKFDELMRWFFQELHEDLAKRRRLLPARKEDLVEFQCCNLNGDEILRRVEQEIT